MRAMLALAFVASLAVAQEAPHTNVAPPEGEFERDLLAAASANGITKAEGGLERLLPYLAGIVQAAPGHDLSPLVANALRRPLSLDAVASSLAERVRAATATPEPGAWAALAQFAVDGQATAGGNVVALAREEAVRWRDLAVGVIRQHRDSVTLTGKNLARELEFLAAGPALASRALSASTTRLAHASDAERELVELPRGIPQALRERVERATTGEILAAAEHDGLLWLVGGPGANKYVMTHVARVLELGGDDRYEWNETFGGSEQLVFDLAGADRYESSCDFSGPGVALFGTALVDDRAGDDQYVTQRCFAQACGLFGIGLVLDRAGDDTYSSTSATSGFAQGVGYWGAGVLVDLAGADRYVGEKLSQGVGGPRGLGLVVDATGDDRYTSNGPSFASVYGTPDAFAAFSQGFGYGLRSRAAGGTGALFDLAGDDRYDAGEFAQGCGYFFGLGVLHDERGSDDYVGQRYVQGASAHQAAGILVDGSGDDRYTCKQVAFQGGAWDQSVAWLVDRSGNDHYTGFGLGQGAAAQQALGVLVDLDGVDRYDSPDAQGQSGANDYHFERDHVLSFSALLDRGGDDDTYSTARTNGATSVTSPVDAPATAATRSYGVCVDN